MKGVCAVAALSVALTIVPAAAADTPVIQAGPASQTALEQIASQIASHIAARAVVVRCDSQQDWIARGLPSFELGFVNVLYQTFGALTIGRQIDTVAHLAPSVCQALITFATASMKPTKCSVLEDHVVTKKVRVRSYTLKTARVRKKVNGKFIYVTTTRRVPDWVYQWKNVTTHIPSQPQTCYVSGQQGASIDPGFWDAYESYTYGLLALAHESIHLAGVVGGVLSNGLAVGDQQAEAKANCYGLQWLPYVAQQLGDDSTDSLAIGQWAYDVLYPGYQGSAYWSADCAPGGAMDIRYDKNSAWP